MIETNTGDYPPRTKLNVKTSDGTVVFGDSSDIGTALTLRYLDWEDKPFIVNPSIDELVEFITSNKIEILNVAGTRGSRMTNNQKEQILQIMIEAFKQCI